MTPYSNRPTSPHLQEYKLPLTAIISISHRMTGVLLSAGLILIVFILSAMANGESAYQSMQELLNIWLVKLIYFGFVFALFFHLCHGVRHLFWDAGQGFERETLKNYALIELAVALLLTLIAIV